MFKQLGVTYRDPSGRLVLPDDPRIADLWEAAAELNVPVLIHTADPVAFFRPLDGTNERWDELQRHPDWHFFGGDYPPFEELIAALYRAIEAHPRTQFITAHVCCYPENLAFASGMLERYPNLSTDFSARIGELGRAPYSAREWFIKYADRIVFGTDATPVPELSRRTTASWRPATSISTTRIVPPCRIRVAGTSTGWACPTRSCARCTARTCAVCSACADRTRRSPESAPVR